MVALSLHNPLRHRLHHGVVADEQDFVLRMTREPLADDVAIVSTSGGAGIIAADKAEDQGVGLATLAPATEAALAAIVPDFGSPRNPCDLTAQVLNDPVGLNPWCLNARPSSPP